MSEDSDVLRVVGAVADKTQVTLYLEDGKTKIIKQGDLRLNKLLEKIIPITTAGKVAVVSLETLSVYQDFEKKSGGFIKFFKGAKKTISGLFGGDKDEPEEIILPPVQAPPVAPVVPAPQAPPVAPVATPKPIPTSTVGEDLQKSRQTVANQIANKPEIKAPEPKGNLHKVQEHLKPMTGDDIADDETIVAVIGNMAIPDMEKLKPYIQHSIKANSIEAVTNFLKRLIPMIGKREHSIVDIMRFMEKGDLPLANDGSILAYKKLRTNGKTFVDSHSRSVTQRVGSYVCVDEKLVDKNRRNECSNGLHIGRRSYMGGFGGDVIVLTKVAPEDIVTVPHNDPNKVRVMGYHIIGMLSPTAYTAINSNRAMTDNREANEMLARAIKGDHIERIEEVRIHGQMGANTVITPLIQGKRKEIADRLTNAELSQGKAFDDPTSGLGAVDPKAINKQINEQITKSGMTAADTFKDVAKEAIPAPQPQPVKPIDVINNPPTKEGEKVINEALKQGKKSPAKKPAAPKAKAPAKATEKPASKAKTPTKTNSTKTAPAPKAEPVKASPKAAAKATSIAKATGPAKKTSAKPAAKAEPKKETTAVSKKVVPKTAAPAKASASSKTSDDSKNKKPISKAQPTKSKK